MFPQGSGPSPFDGTFQSHIDCQAKRRGQGLTRFLESPSHKVKYGLLMALLITDVCECHNDCITDERWKFKQLTAHAAKCLTFIISARHIICSADSKFVKIFCWIG